MVRLIVFCIVGLCFSVSVPVDASEDSRYYMLLNRLRKIDSDIVELKRLRVRVSQLEVINTQHERTMDEESLRMGKLE